MFFPFCVICTLVPFLFHVVSLNNRLCLLATNVFNFSIGFGNFVVFESRYTGSKQYGLIYRCYAAINITAVVLTNDFSLI